MMMRVAAVLSFPLVLLGLLGGCRQEAETPVSRPDTPVFLISIDTLRSDRLPMYGYGGVSTPALDAFRQDAVLFRHAFSHVPLTLPAHSSLFTGKLPFVHGVRDNLGYDLDGSHTTLATQLKQSGYQTGGAVSSFVLRDDSGIASGFDFYDDYMTHSPQQTATSWQRDGEQTRQSLSAWLDSISSRKIFGFLHIYEPHTPYTPPAEYDGIADRYDAEVAYADAIVGRFLEDLKRRGLYDDSLIIVLSDHGEGLGDHGEQEHGIFLYREAIQVPLLVKLPARQRAGEEVDRQVALVDVMPTILTHLGLPATGLDGYDLLAVSPAPGRTIYSETFYPRLHYGWSELASVIDDESHYIHAPRVELYRYRTDVAEEENVAEANRRSLAALRQEASTILADHPFQEPALSDPEDMKKLAALGYVGSTGPTAQGSLPDPKDKLPILQVYGQANDALRQGEPGRAIELLEPLLKENPDFISGYGVLAESYRKSGRREKALETLKSQMTLTGGHGQVAIAIAELLMEMKRFDEAREHARLAEDMAGAFVHDLLAMIAMGEGDLATAEREAQASLKMEADRVQPVILLSEIRRSQERYGEELELLERADEIVRRRQLPPIKDLQMRRGESLLRVRRVSDAETAFRAETSNFPAQLKAWGQLAVVVAAQGRRTEAREILAQARRANPGPEAVRMSFEALMTVDDRDAANELRARMQ